MKTHKTRKTGYGDLKEGDGHMLKGEEGFSEGKKRGTNGN